MAAKQVEPVTISEKVTFAIQENRILTLGTEVLLGFQYTAFFTPGFNHLNFFDQGLLIGSQALLLVVLSLLLASASFHRVAFQGHDRPEVSDFANRMAELSLLPFAAAIGMDLKVVVGHASTQTVGTIAGGIVTLLALLLWYWAGWRHHMTDQEEEIMDKRRPKTDPEKLPQRIERMLSEIRVVLPGVQALLGFQFSAILQQSFENLSSLDKHVHVGALISMAVAGTLLMAPAAYHRLATRGDAAPSVLSFGHRAILIAMAALSVGLSADIFVILNKAMGANVLAGGGAMMADFSWSECGSACRWSGVSPRVRRLTRERQSVLGQESVIKEAGGASGGELAFPGSHWPHEFPDNSLLR
jgi:hypothetical protein